jgi:hypothetical protein
MKRKHKKLSREKRLILVAAIASMLIFLVFVPLAMPKTVIVPAIYQVLQNYQDDPNGGNGWLRLYTFKPAENSIHVRTYSPYLDAFGSEFSLPMSLNGTEEYTFVVLPDTQYYSASYPEIFMAQAEWVVENKEAFNIKFVIHLGDLVDDPYVTAQWEVARSAINYLLVNGVPCSVLPGNHDLITDDFGQLNPMSYRAFFGATQTRQDWAPAFSTFPWYGGSYSTFYEDDNANNYCLLDMGAEKYLILSLQWKPPLEVLAWANNVIDSYPDYKVIVATHEYLEQSGWLPGQRSSVGDLIWRELAWKQRDQTFLVLCGHFMREDLVIDYLDLSMFFLWWLQ